MHGGFEELLYLILMLLGLFLTIHALYSFSEASIFNVIHLSFLQSVLL